MQHYTTSSSALTEDSDLRVIAAEQVDVPTLVRQSADVIPMASIYGFPRTVVPIGVPFAGRASQH